MGADKRAPKDNKVPISAPEGGKVPGNSRRREIRSFR